MRSGPRNQCLSLCLCTRNSTAQAADTTKASNWVIYTRTMRLVGSADFRNVFNSYYVIAWNLNSDES